MRIKDGFGSVARSFKAWECRGREFEFKFSIADSLDPCRNKCLESNPTTCATIILESITLREIWQSIWNILIKFWGNFRCYGGDLNELLTEPHNMND